MVCRILKGVEAGSLPDGLGQLPVEAIDCLSPAGIHQINFPNLFSDLCGLLSKEAADRLANRYRDPHETATALMLSLLDALPTGTTLVLLDNLEVIMDNQTHAINDGALEEALKAAFAAPEHGLKFIVTSRTAPTPLLTKNPAVQVPIDLDNGLDSPYAERILRAMDPTGRLGLRDASDPLLTRARAWTGGFPRALEALAAILNSDRSTTLEQLLAGTAPLSSNVVQDLVREAFNRLDSIDESVMQALAIYDRPVAAVAVDYLLQPYQPAINSAPILDRLVGMQFVRRDAGMYYLHQVDRDQALQHVPVGQPDDH
jgi:hypothetical protein